MNDKQRHPTTNDALTIADQNIERLLASAYAPETPDADFADRVAASVREAVRQRGESARVSSAGQWRARANWHGLTVRLASLAAVALIALLVYTGLHEPHDYYQDGELVWIDGRAYTPAESRTGSGLQPAPLDRVNTQAADVMRYVSTCGMTPRPLAAPPESTRIGVGDIVMTGAVERRRVTLPDGSVLYVNVDTTVHLEDARRLAVDRGEVFVEVAPSFADAQSREKFVVATPTRAVTALGTKFAVRVGDDSTKVLVTQGKVALDQPASNDDSMPHVQAGQQATLRGDAAEIQSVPRATRELDWTRDLAAAARSPLVPESQHAGGALVVVDPNGQEMKLSLRKYHVDVYIEDGFARTTIDQTFFNHTHSREEGTFYFPLPPDASLSRLAMYVNGKLMEGGMAERDYARQVFETIKYRSLDPALLEWVDGSTFKMRVFPLEGRQEKRIILSYTQRLSDLFGQMRYQFPAGHNMDSVGKWSAQIVVRGGDGWQWQSMSHQFDAAAKQGDLVLTATAENIKPDRDILLDLTPPARGTQFASLAQFSKTLHEGQQYLQVRFRPELHRPAVRERRDWIFLFDASGDRDPLLARAQIEVIRSMLENAEHDDTFTVLTAGTRLHAWSPKRQSATHANVADALAFLDETHLVGALDVERAFTAIAPLIESAENPIVVHVGSATPILGERADEKLAALLPQQGKYVGVGVGKRWNRALMKLAASRTGGYYTQINPDEDVRWRAFGLLTALDTPRLLDVTVKADDTGEPLLVFEDSLSHGESLRAIGRRDSSKSLPRSVTLAGTLDGEPFMQVLPVVDVAPKAEHLPRMWAKLEIERLAALGLLENKDRIIALSKSMYVMSPFTSLLVLENDEMYTQYNIDRGRKDHWAMYPCPDQIEVVHEPLPGPPTPSEKKSEDAAAQPTVDVTRILSNILVRVPSPILHLPSDSYNSAHVVTAWQRLTGAYAVPVPTEEMWYDESGVRNYWGVVPWSFAPVDTTVFATDGGTVLLGGMQRRSELFSVTNGRVPMFRYLTPSLTPAIRTTDEWDITRTPVTFSSDIDSTSFEITDFGTVIRLTDPTVQWSEDGRRLRAANGLKQIGLTVHNYYDGASNTAWFGNRFDIPGRFNFNTVTSGGRSAQLPLGSETWNRPHFAPPLPIRVASQGLGTGLSLMVTPRIIIQEEEEARLGLDFDSDGLFDAIWLDDGLSINDWISVPAVATDFEKSRQSLRESLLDGLTNRIRQSTVGQVRSYERPQFTGDMRVFADLLAFAPGMNTLSVDAVAAVDRERESIGVIERGVIDPAARDLIERARSAGWQSVTIAVPNQEPLTVVCDGAGRFRYERRTVDGLREIVIGDGATLWHLYQELGVGAKRPMSRAYRELLASLVPWTLPPSEDLAVGADVRAVDEQTVAIVPRKNAGTEVEAESSAAETDGKQAASRELRLVFADNGRLVERQIVNTDDGKIVGRVVFDATGQTRILDAKGQQLARAELRRVQTTAPALEFDASRFVVLPMPFQRRDVATADVPRQGDGSWQPYAEWDEEAALRLLAADICTHAADAHQVIAQRFLARGDRRIGFFTLMLSAYQYWNPDEAWQLDGKSVSLDPMTGNEDQPLARYIRTQLDVMQRGNAVEPTKLSALSNEFIQQLAEFQRQHLGWSTGRFKQGEDTKINARYDQLAEYLEHCRSPQFVWALLPSLNRANHDLRNWQRQARLYERLAEGDVLREYARFEHARSLLNVSRCEGANELKAPAVFGVGVQERALTVWEDLIKEQVAGGQLPWIDNDVRDAFESWNDGSERYSQLMKRAAESFVAAGRRPTAISLAWQLRQTGSHSLASEVLDMALAGTPDEDRLGVTLAAVEYLWSGGGQARALAMLEPLLADAEYQSLPEMWRLAAAMAEQQGRLAESLRYEECALDYEFEHLPEQVNLEAIRSRYGEILGRYERLATAIATLEQQPSQELIQRVVKMADRWRALDDDVTQSCQSAARIFTTLGADELAWEYLTTPLADKPNEAQPWVALATTLAGQHDIAMADRAYTAAFQAEGSNAQILWDHAKLLERHGRFAEARRLYELLADRDWQPRFQSLRAQARQILGRQ